MKIRRLTYNEERIQSELKRQKKTQLFINRILGTQGFIQGSAECNITFKSHKSIIEIGKIIFFSLLIMSLVVCVTEHHYVSGAY